MQNLQENPTNRMGLYIVQEGDCVQSIASRHNVPPIVLIANNQLKAEPKVGTMLVLPQHYGTLYTVQVGESVESICQKFAITKEEFLQKNGCSAVFPTLLVAI